MEKDIVKDYKYPIHKDFEKLISIKIPLENEFFVFITQQLLGLLWNGRKGDKDCTAKKINIPFGKKRLRAIVYEPTNIKENAPCLVYYHGGGFVIPAAQHHYNAAKTYATRLGCKVVFVDYPLAPANKYPIPVDACYAAYCWTVNHAEKLGINPNKVAVGGDSAGGNLSSAVCIKAYDNKFKMPCAQLLIYPASGSRELTESMKKYTDTPMCNSKDYNKYIKYYFGKGDYTQYRYASPVVSESYNIFPATYIETAEFDCLRDEALMFAENLLNAGVNTVVHNTFATVHGYDIIEDSSITKDSMNKRVEFLKKQFEKV